MLPRRLTRLNSGSGRDDIGGVMSTTHHNNVPGGSDTSAERRFAHELANLMDGSMRNVSLLASTLRDTAAAGETPDDDTLQRLESVEQSMRQMTTLLKRWTEQGGDRPAALHDDQRSLAEVVAHAVTLFRPAADAMRIEMNQFVEESLAAMPAGPVCPFFANGLRNAIEAIGLARTQGKPCGRVDVAAALDDDGWVVLTISDDGTGVAPELLDGGNGAARIGETTKPSGHGLGLALCRDIAVALNGTLTLAGNDQGGATLTLRFPAR